MLNRNEEASLCMSKYVFLHARAGLLRVPTITQKDT